MDSSLRVLVWFSVIWLNYRETTLLNHGLPPNALPGANRITKKDWRQIFGTSIGTIFGTLLVIYIWGLMPDSVTSILSIVLLVGLMLAIAFVIYKDTHGKHEWSRMSVIVILAIFNIVFWLGFEQAGGTFNLFAKENTNRYIAMLDYEVPASWFQNLNSLVILFGAPYFQSCG